MRITYGSGSGREWTAEVDPWAVVVRHGRWYLLCHSHRVEAVRTYRVDRIRAVELLERAFEPPLEPRPGRCPRGAPGRRVGAPHPGGLRGTSGGGRALGPAADGPARAAGDGCVLVGSTSNPTMYAAEWLSRVPLPFRVEGGPELVEAVAALAARLSAAVPASGS